MNDARRAKVCAEWRRLLQDASEGPWRTSYAVKDEACDLTNPNGEDVGGWMTRPDAKLIAWMRNHAEEIIAALEARAPASEPEGRSDP